MCLNPKQRPESLETPSALLAAKMLGEGEESSSGGDHDGGGGPLDDTGGPGGDGSGGMATSEGPGGSSDDTGGSPGADDGGTGCGCTPDRPVPAGWWAWAVGVATIRRRRSAATRAR